MKNPSGIYYKVTHTKTITYKWFKSYLLKKGAALLTRKKLRTIDSKQSASHEYDIYIYHISYDIYTMLNFITLFILSMSILSIFSLNFVRLFKQVKEIGNF